MEIRQVLRGNNASPATSAPKAKAAESKTDRTARPSTDRVELSRQWIESMEEQRAQAEAALLGGGKDKKSDGILGMLDEPTAEEQEMDALAKELDVQMKCLKIAMNLMKGKKVPPEDEKYLMENDPKGYKIAIAMKALVKEDKKECKSVLKDEDKNGEASETSEGGESAPAEAPSDGGGEAASSGGETE